MLFDQRSVIDRTFDRLCTQDHRLTRLIGLCFVHRAYSAAAFSGGRTYLSRIVTNSSAALGWMPTVASNCFLVAPHFTAMARPWTISGASGPSMWQPTTRSVLASTTSFMKMRSARPDSVFFIGLKRDW